MLVAHLDRGLGKRPTYELRLTLNEATWRRADEAVEVDGTRGGGGLDAGEGGAVCKVAA